MNENDMFRVVMEESFPTDYIMVPNFLMLLPDLTNEALFLYVHYLAVSGDSDNNTVSISNESICEKCNMDSEMLRNAKQNLVDLRLIEIKNQQGITTTSILNVWKRNAEVCKRAERNT